MKCPNCGAEMKEGTLYCEHCGEDIHIVPDFEPEIEYNMEQTLHDIAREMTPEEDATDDQDAQQSSQHTGDGAVQTAVGKFFLVHLLLSLLSLLACACHIQAQFLHGGGLGIKFAHDLAFVHHQNAV